MNIKHWKQVIFGRLALFGIALLTMPHASFAASTDLANQPLSASFTVSVKPNIMFVLDDSGSMDWDFMPDYVDSAYCRDDDDNGTALNNCRAGDPPYFANQFNYVYYDPEIYYQPPVNADGTLKTSYNTNPLWQAVPNDGYGVQFAGTTNLLTDYPERVWCQDAALTSCKQATDASGNYVYPNTTYNRLKTVTGAPYYYTTTVMWCKARNTSGQYYNFGNGVDCSTKQSSTYKYVQYGTFTRVDIVPSTTSYAKAATRTDCAGATCTYAEEMTNFANWYAWYRTRMQMMKSAAGRAFSTVSDDYRVGFNTISYTGTSTTNAKFLDIADFDATQKASWYSKFYAINPSSSTPLRGALSKVGRIYAGQIGDDPVQYSCQQNFTILSTDGYWNTNAESSTYGPFKIDGTTSVGDQDGAASAPSYDKLGKSNTLADIAYYYYHTDLRPSMNDNVVPAGTNTAVDDIATHQHMTTFTLGLGVDGTLTYQEDYKSAGSGDYYDILQGTKWWPDPINNSGGERIDDLWHAAVDGRGTYFSARNPALLKKSLDKALSAISATKGAAAAAATSTLEPVAGDNYAYIATFTTASWDGNIARYTIDLGTGAISATADWNASGLLNAKVSATSDTRTIYTYDSTNAFSTKLKPFTWSNLTSTEKSYFNPNQLNQWTTDYTAADKYGATNSPAAFPAPATPTIGTDYSSLVNFLRGQTGFEDQTGNNYKLYRDRANTFGDIVHSQPVYVKQPPYSYVDTGYDVFKATVRDANVYVAANDGMLHALDAVSGQERWAYIPSLLLPDLYRLADKTYPTNHRFYADGPINVGDIYDGSSWRTILVGGLGKGGRGYYALDITNPAAPKALWNFTVNEDNDVGYSYGFPIITKRDSDGKWVVLVTSGYNNVSPGDGKGYLYVLDAVTGQKVTTNGKLATNTGDTTTPSGLGKINNWVDNQLQDNKSKWVYGGDLNGSLWRFNLNDGTVSKLAQLGSGVNAQPITTTPELGDYNGTRIVFVGTGKYLGTSDLTDTGQRSFYALKEDLTTSLGDVRTSGDLVKQTLSAVTSTTRTVTSNPVDWTAKAGWYIDFPDSGERVNVDPKLAFGTIQVATSVPNNDACNAGGYSWLYFFDYKTGSFVSTSPNQISGVKIASSLAVGLNTVTLPGNKNVTIVTTSSNEHPVFEVPIGTNAPGGKRVSWRELIAQ